MLVLSRKVGESICIGDNIEVTISRIQGSQVRISIQAPREVSIRRSELPENSPMSAAETYRLLASEAGRRSRSASDTNGLSQSGLSENALGDLRLADDTTLADEKRSDDDGRRAEDREGSESLPSIVPLLARRNRLPPPSPRG